MALTLDTLCPQQARTTVTRRWTKRPDFNPQTWRFVSLHQLVKATEICGQRSGLRAYGINPLVLWAPYCGRQIEECSEPL